MAVLRSLRNLVMERDWAGSQDVPTLRMKINYCASVSIPAVRALRVEAAYVAVFVALALIFSQFSGFNGNRF